MLAAVTARFASDPTDTSEITSEKTAILLLASSTCVAGSFWVALYLVVFGWGLTAALPLSFVIIVGTSLIVAHVTKNHYYAVYGQIICIIYVTAFIQWSIGGVFDSGFVMAWAATGPLTALMFLSTRESVFWFLTFLLNLVVTLAFNSTFADRALDVTDDTRLLFFALNLGVSSLVVFVFARYFVAAALRERSRANRLLLNVLPRQIAETLKASDETIAQQFDSVSVLFADVVGSTPLFADLEPTEVVDWLNEVFSALDEVVERHGLEKLRTMGDNYMVAAGVPVTRDDHAHAITACALSMIEATQRIPARNGKRIGFRFGINSGPVVAGVIGKSKFHYDMWGDTVNIASRMESHGEVDRLQVSNATYELIKDRFECVPRGPVNVKGKGEMKTWFVSGPKSG